MLEGMIGGLAASSRGVGAVVVLLSLSSITARAAITPCANSPVGTTLAVGGYIGSGNGCAAIDLSFENFSITGGATGGFVAPTANNTAIWATGTLPVGDTVGPVRLTINPTPATNWESNNGNSTLTMTLNYIVVAHSSGSYTGGSYPGPATSGFEWFFDALALTINGSVGNASGQSIVVTQTICLNATTTTGCGAPALGVITATIPSNSSTPTYACSESSSFLNCTGGNQILDIINGLQVQQIALTTQITANRTNATGNVVDLNFIQLEFTQYADTPEPSSWLLLGSALALIGFKTRRRHGA